ncbi:MAG TPA: hypothetical protein VK279_01060, partial [Solirubrobacteraceae bacterium]|nr:hypothetical protein [Solirubrobacteraceae bacterium]
MSTSVGTGAAARLLAEAPARRAAAGERLFTSEADRIARLCHRMAERFARGGRLIAAGRGPAARSDARHVAVEFVHPVIVGKRALPALALTADGGPLGAQLDLAAEPDDIVMAFDAEPEVVPAARARGCLTIAFTACGAEWELPSPDPAPFVAQELIETLYHVLWELGHVFFEHRGLLEGRRAGPVHDVGASSFLYPFLGEREDDLETVVADVRRSVLVKAHEVAVLRERTVREGAGALAAGAAALRGRLDAGGRLLALGNGGSATDAMDVVA